MSIFGKRKTIDMTYLHNLKDKIDSFKDGVIISAESKGGLEEDEVMSFGNGGRDSGSGLVIPRSGRILGYGLSSKRESGVVRVGISVNKQLVLSFDLDENTDKTYGDFAEPLSFNAGDMINFINIFGNPTTVNTVASLLIELI